MKNILQTSIKSLNTAALAAAVFASITSHAADQPISPADQAYFEGKIRPILIKYCYNCHGNGATKGSLDLSSKAGTLFAGSNGAAVVPGYPGKSLIIKRLKDLNDPMPPAGKDAPTQAEIAELKNWISQGAPDPRIGMKPIMDRERAKNHPLFQKVKPPTIPSPQVVMNGKLKNWCKNPIDSYVLKKLEKQNMVPSRRAEKWSLLRRVYFDLIGLPPSFDDVQRFVNGFESYEQVVDRLLASPQYGERWGRHWLDVARYADTTGNNNRRGRPSRYIHAYTYRDWVINALNADMPYDQFLINQIAADRKQESPVNLPALGFLTLGPRVAGDVEIIDDRIDVITRGTMGLSVYCARCHDHKFDPIPTADYYSLVGVLKNSRELSEEEKSTLIQNSQKGTGAGGSIFYISTDPDYAKYTAEKEKLENNYKQFRLLEEYKVNSNSRAHAAAYMYWTDSFAKQKKRVERNRREFERILDENEKKRTGKKDAKSKIKLRAVVGEAWQRYLSRKSEQDRVFGPWKIYSNVSTDHLGRWYPKDQKKLQEAHRKVASMIPNAGAKAGEMGKQFNPYVADLFRTPPASMSDVAGRYHSLFELAKKQWLYVDGVSYIMRKQAKARGEKMDPPGNMEDAQNRFGVEFDEQFGKDYAKNMDEIRRVLFDQGHPGKFSFDTIKRVNGTLRQQEREWFISKLTSLKRSIAPKLPPILTDKPNPRDEAIRIKGERNRPGKVVPRQFPEILAGPDRQPFKVGSGRLELAQAIASKDNPLTARVMVNRIWMHHFGKGIVASINEFGLRATDPSHPELLDYLAWYFTGNNWSMKALHKHILMSNTYQQTSQDNPRYSVMDPENINYYKMDRRRLDLESFRDGLIQVSGVLDLNMGGRPVRLPNYRRTVYGLVDRRNLDEMFKTFDFPNPNSTAGQRFISTVSQQALFMMNSPMLADLAHQIVLRKEFRDIQNDRSRIASLYNMIYQRDPKPIELKLGQRYLQKQIGGVPNGAMRVQTWDNGYGQWGVVDAKNKFYSVTFRPFPFTDGKVWKGNTPAFGPLKLTATGGHPGTQSNVAVIRRWVAPRDTTVNISGRLEHQLDDAAKAIYDKQFNAGHRKWYDENAWNGVTGIVVVSSAGQSVGKEIWRSDVRRGRRDVNVSDIKIRRGGTIDFIITCNKNINPKTLNAIATTFKLTNPQQDNFTWNPTVSIKKEIAEAMKEKASSLLITSWTASEEFQGATYKPKPLNAWEKYVQVLLLSNELAYVD